MKLTIIALVLSISLVQSSDFIGSEKYLNAIKNRTECFFSYEDLIINCHGPTGFVQCESEAIFEEIAEPLNTIYAIGLWEEVPHGMRYKIISRSLDDTTWLDNNLGMADNEKLISIYHSDKYNDYGIKIKDSKCFNQMVDLFKNSLRNERLEVTNKNNEKYWLTVIADLYQRPDHESEEDKRSIDLEDEIEMMKDRISEEWDINIDNTKELVKEMNTMKRDIEDLKKKLAETLGLEKRNARMWNDERLPRKKWNQEQEETRNMWSQE